MVADECWKYLYSEVGGTEELYDLAADPGELTNLAARPASADRLALMRQRLRAWAQVHGDLGILAGDGLAVNPRNGAESTGFQARVMGWRWY